MTEAFCNNREENFLENKKRQANLLVNNVGNVYRNIRNCSTRGYILFRGPAADTLVDRMDKLLLPPDGVEVTPEGTALTATTLLKDVVINYPVLSGEFFKGYKGVFNESYTQIESPTVFFTASDVRDYAKRYERVILAVPEIFGRRPIMQPVEYATLEHYARIVGARI